jgi:hypothetical protein
MGMFPVTPEMHLVGGSHGQNRLLCGHQNPCFLCRLPSRSTHRSQRASCAASPHLTPQTQASDTFRFKPPPVQQRPLRPPLQRELKSRGAQSPAVARCGLLRTSRYRAPYPSYATLDSEKGRKWRHRPCNAGWYKFAEFLSFYLVRCFLGL